MNCPSPNHQHAITNQEDFFRVRSAHALSLSSQSLSESPSIDRDGNRNGIQTVSRRSTEVSPTDSPDLLFVHDSLVGGTVRVAFEGEPGIDLKQEGDKHEPGDHRECHHAHPPQSQESSHPRCVTCRKIILLFGHCAMIERRIAVVVVARSSRDVSCRSRNPEAAMTGRTGMLWSPPCLP